MKFGKEENRCHCAECKPSTTYDTRLKVEVMKRSEGCPFSCDCQKCQTLRHELMQGEFSMSNLRKKAGCLVLEQETNTILHWVDIYLTNIMPGRIDITHADVRWSQVAAIGDSVITAAYPRVKL